MLLSDHREEGHRAVNMGVECNCVGRYRLVDPAGQYSSQFFGEDSHSGGRGGRGLLRLRQLSLHPRLNILKGSTGNTIGVRVLVRIGSRILLFRRVTFMIVMLRDAGEAGSCGVLRDEGSTDRHSISV